MSKFVRGENFFFNSGDFVTYGRGPLVPLCFEKSFCWKSVGNNGGDTC